MKNNCLFFSIVFFVISSFAQVGVGTTSPHPSSILELNSNDKGFLMPRLTTSQRNQITNPTEGLMVFNTDRNAIQFFRQNVGASNSLNGWFDIACSKDIDNAINNFPAGIILDFSDLATNGLLYEDIGANPTQQITASSPDGTGIGSIGPIPSDLNNLSGSTKYIQYINDSEPGELGNNPNFVLKNVQNTNPNDYNASTFLSRSGAYAGNGIDMMHIDFDANYTGDYDLILVAKFDVIPTVTRESFFQISTVAHIGAGGGAGSGSCSIDYFSIKRNSSTKCGHNANPSLDRKVSLDTDFHRFRIKNFGGSSAQLYIDGVLVDEYTSPINIDELSFFSNKGKGRSPESSIAFLGIFTTHLSSEDANNFDQYLACKFEQQP